MTAIVTLDSIAHAFAAESRAPRTRQEYARQCRLFASWCVAHGVPSLPADPQTIARFIADRAAAGLKPGSLQVALAAIGAAHGKAGHGNPCKHPSVTEVWTGVRRTLGTAPRQVDPVLASDLREICARLPPSLLGTRDRALLLIGFAGAFRRSELVGLDVDHVQWSARGIVVSLARSKTDQAGAGFEKGIRPGERDATCPVRALQAWLAASRIAEGAVFRHVDRHGRVRARLSAAAVADVVKRSCDAAGIDPDRVAGHSLRSGLATSAIRAGKTDRAAMAQGGWKSRASFDRYVRRGTILDDGNASGGIGL